MVPNAIKLALASSVGLVPPTKAIVSTTRTYRRAMERSTSSSVTDDAVEFTAEADPVGGV